MNIVDSKIIKWEMVEIFYGIKYYFMMLNIMEYGSINFVFLRLF